MKFAFCLLLALFAGSLMAQDLSGDAREMDRDPASVPHSYSGKRTYPGGADEEDLQVQTTLPEALIKTDARSVQREVYKNLYNQEMKEERAETLEE